MWKVLESIVFFPSVTRIRVMLLLGLIWMAALSESFGMAMLFPVMDFLEKGKNFDVLAQSSRMWFYMDQVFNFLHLPKNLIVLMSIVFGLLLVRQLFQYLKNAYNAWISESLFDDIRSIGFRSFIHSDVSFYDVHGSGELVNALTADGLRAASAIFAFFNLISALTIFAAYLAFLVILSPWMTLFAMGVIAMIALALKSRIQKSRTIGDQVSAYNEKISSAIIERINGLRLVKLTATEEDEAALVRRLSERIKVDGYRLSEIQARMDFIVDPLVVLAGLSILYLSVEVFRMTLAQTGIFVLVLVRLIPYSKDVFKAKQTLAGRTGSLLNVKRLIEKAREARTIQGGQRGDVALRNSIRFQNVSFRFGGEKGFTLNHINLAIPAGRMTALVGRSGAGKSTLVDLIPRLRVPQEGRILFDEVPIEEFQLSSLRRSIAYVSQEGFLFNKSVEDNIRYCFPAASEEEVREAARMAYADGFIRELPQGYQTLVGERGVRLSGGQRQRIILARALLQKSMVIMLDEPTSALDSQSEQYIQAAMEKLRAGAVITLIVIAHRLSTIRSADQIIVLDEGRVVECGGHGELMHDDSWYAEMVRMQASA